LETAGNVNTGTLTTTQFDIMKRIVKRTGFIAAVIMLLFSATTQNATAQGGYNGGYNDDYVSYDDYSDGSYQDFYNDLSPYGQWIDDPQYGYVWRPDVDNDFRPYYSRGHWVMTDYGNTWVSDYRWGWAAFHYGRWTYDNYYGWVWIPGSQWAPAWVSWRNGGGYYGWAPLGPGVNISVSLGNNWWGGDFWWTFIPQQYLFSNNFYSYYRGPRYNNTCIRNTTYIYNTNVSNHVTYYYGPRSNEYQRATNQRVNIYKINNERRPGATAVRGNAVSLYRPPIRNNAMVNGRRPAPANAIEAPRAINRPNAVSVNPQTAMPATRPSFNPRDYRNTQQQPVRNNSPLQQNRNNAPVQQQPQQQVRQPRATAPVQNMDNRGMQQMQQQRANQQRMDQQRAAEQQQRATEQQRANQQQLQQQRANQQVQQQRAAEQQRVNQQRMDQQRAAEQQRAQQQVQQQRAAEQQRANQQRMDQQRAAEQQRAQQMQQQRAAQQQQVQQQRAAEQQRANQQRMDQQRAAEQQRTNQQRVEQQRPAPQEERGSDRRR